MDARHIVFPFMTEYFLIPAIACYVTQILRFFHRLAQQVDLAVEGRFVLPKVKS